MDRGSQHLPLCQYHCHFSLFVSVFLIASLFLLFSASGIHRGEQRLHPTCQKKSQALLVELKTTSWLLSQKAFWIKLFCVSNFISKEFKPVIPGYNWYLDFLLFQSKFPRDSPNPNNSTLVSPLRQNVTMCLLSVQETILLIIFWQPRVVLRLLRFPDVSEFSVPQISMETLQLLFGLSCPSQSAILKVFLYFFIEKGRERGEREIQIHFEMWSFTFARVIY